jgi:hypothetical protein
VFLLECINNKNWGILKTYKGLTVTLAAAILASGCGVASAVPAFAATSTTTSNATTANTAPLAPYPPTSLQSKNTYWDSYSKTWTGNLTWTAPTVLSGKVERYMVDVMVNGQLRTYNTTSTFLNLPGLLPNTTYTVKVRAIVLGSNGVTRIVTPAASLIYKAPAAPVVASVTNLQVIGLDAYNVRLGWTAPANTDVVQYTVAVSPGPGQATGQQFRSYTPSAFIPRTALVRGYQYTVTVKAYGITTSGAVQPSVGTTFTFIAP